MPIPKPDQIIRHQLVLGRTERELLEGISAAYATNRIMTPLVSLLSDVSAMTTLFVMLEAAGIIDVIPNEIMVALEGGLYDSYEAFQEAWLAAENAKREAENVIRVANGLAPLAILTMPLATPLKIPLAFAWSIKNLKSALD